MRFTRSAARLVLAALPLVAASSALAQDDFNDAAAMGVCAALSGVLILIPIAILAINIAILVWVHKDAKARGMDNPVIWMILVLFTSVIGLIIYLLSRPKGEKVPCASCGNNRLTGLAKCPHCGNA